MEEVWSEGDELEDDAGFLDDLDAYDEIEEQAEDVYISEQAEAVQTKPSAELEITRASEGRLGPGPHEVVQGECLAGIAYRAGFFEETLWNLGENSQLRRKRRDGQYLLPGDVIVIPELELKWESASTEARHRFVRKGVPAKLRLRLMLFGHPRSEVEYLLNVDGHRIRGKTDRNGWLTESIPPDAVEATIQVNPGPEEDEYYLVLGSVDPIDEISGIQRRLADLGLSCRITGQLDNQTKAAVRQFQEARDLEATGNIDDPTKQELKRAHEE